MSATAAEAGVRPGLAPWETFPSQRWDDERDEAVAELIRGLMAG
ncbi:MAG TPA: hypothetical protein VM093_07245 [Aeromicrobium sp.]|nr:hypothetical protein [Aeromicrobium sp.]